MPTYGYCSVDDVASCFPFLKRNQPGSIQDTEIQGWIANRKARIRSAWLTRGFDPDASPNPPLTTDQTNFLRSLNADGAIADLGDALQGTNSLQPGEYSIPAAHRATYERVLKEITQAMHDSLFFTGPNGLISRNDDPTPQFEGIGGAEIPDTETPPVLQTNVLLYKNMRF